MINIAERKNTMDTETVTAMIITSTCYKTPIDYAVGNAVGNAMSITHVLLVNHTSLTKNF